MKKCSGALMLIVDPLVGAASVRNQLFRLEPQVDLPFGTFQIVTSMACIPASLNAEVRADGPRVGCSRVGLSQHQSSHFHNIVSLPDHGHNRAVAHIFRQPSIEWFILQFNVVLLEKIFGGLRKLHGHQEVALLFKARDYLSYQAPLDTIWLDEKQGAFSATTISHVSAAGSAVRLCPRMQ